jgi:hypothetical protein
VFAERLAVALRRGWPPEGRPADVHLLPAGPVLICTPASCLSLLHRFFIAGLLTALTAARGLETISVAAAAAVIATVASSDSEPAWKKLMEATRVPIYATSVRMLATELWTARDLELWGLGCEV